MKSLDRLISFVGLPKQMYKIVDDYVSRWERQVDISQQLEAQLRTANQEIQRIEREKEDKLAAAAALMEDTVHKQRSHMMLQITMLQGEVKVLTRYNYYYPRTLCVSIRPCVTRVHVPLAAATSTRACSLTKALQVSVAAVASVQHVG
jgi:hypothetical protein